MFLSPNQIDELKLIVERYQLLFIGEHIGWEILTDTDKTVLRQSGIDIDKIMKVGTDDYITTAFKFGILSEALGHKQTQKLSYQDFKKFVAEGKFLPLSTAEKGALDSVKHQMYSDIKGLGNRIKQDVHNVVIEGDKKLRAKYEHIIQKEAERSIANRTSVKDMISRLGHKTQDWSRDFGRISDFIMHTAYDEGRARSIHKRMGGDGLCYKDVYPGACRHCIRLYTTEGVGSEPKIFKISELIANGNNIGRKVHEWLPVVGSTHPFCRCTLNHVPEGYAWNEKTRSFDIPVKYKRQVQRKSKIKVTVGNETTYV